ncbi:MAG TPA: response regulator [Blastocatellia bacterium]|nr:response regulator [Blastocatellia bacterium]
MTPALRVLIVDDEKQARLRLRRMLEEWPDIEIIGDAQNGLEAVEMIESLSPELVLLDIQMPGLGGFEVIRTLKPELRPLVIFVTAYDSFALEAFEVHATDYLLKPVRQQRLREALDRLVAERRAKPDSLGEFREKLDALVEKMGTPERYYSRLTARRGQRIRLIDVSDVVMLYVENRTVHVVTDSDEYYTDFTMRELEEHLDPAVFFRAHRQAFVNLQKIKEIAPLVGGVHELRMSNDRTVEMSRQQSRKLREIFHW